MNHAHNPNLTANAQNLRRNMTKEERALWYDYLKHLPITINRQKVIGRYILDFYCASAKIAIELDGSQHYEDEGRVKDEKRDKYLNERGITVLRYSNRAVNLKFREVCEDIAKHLIRQPTADTFPSRGRPVCQTKQRDAEKRVEEKRKALEEILSLSKHLPNLDPERELAESREERFGNGA
ncbi:MAG: endonuclease domain-containing protein [Schwartzia sp.]|nr:endonuclease domain-containing protein [Schwartzia sp. (in: firmicutes)]